MVIFLWYGKHDIVSPTLPGLLGERMPIHLDKLSAACFTGVVTQIFGTGRGIFTRRTCRFGQPIREFETC